MANKKPLVFIEPLSETLKKLKETLDPLAEEENLEIFAIDNLNEAGQLLPTIGASLVVGSNPKKCALLLKQIGKKLMKNSAKTMLLTNKRIPPKTLDKLAKIGLTECINEPIAPKTLLYKVRLLLKSLPDVSKESKELSLKSIEASNKKKPDDDRVQKINVEKDNTADEQIEIKESKSVEKITQDNPYLEGEVGASRKENQLDKNYEGNVAGTDQVGNEDLETEEEENENVISTHYKGKAVGDLNMIEEENMTGNGKVDRITDEDDLDAIRDAIKEESQKNLTGQAGTTKIQDETMASKDSSQMDLDLEKENERQEEGNESLYDQDEKKSRNRNAMDLEKEGDVAGVIEDEENVLNNRMKGKLSKIAESEDGMISQDSDGPDQLGEEKMVGQIGKITDADDIAEEIRQMKEKLKAQKNQSADSDNVDHIEKYYKGEDGSVEKLTKEEAEKLKRGELDLDLESEKEDEEEVNDENWKDEFDRAKRSKSIKMDLDSEGDEEAEDLLQQDTESEGKDLYKKIDKVAEDAKYSLDEEKRKRKEEREKKEREMNAQNIFDEEKEKRKFNSEQELQEELKRRELEKQEKFERARLQREKEEREEAEKRRLEREKRENTIEGWDKIKHDRTEEFNNDLKKDRVEKEMIIQKADLGEQTIDYNFLKKEFELIEKYGAGAVKNAYKITEEGGRGQDILYKSGQVPFNVEINEIVIEGEKASEQILEKDQLYIPDSKGLEFAILSLNHIINKNVDVPALLTHTANNILSEYQGHTAFFKVNAVTIQWEEMFHLDSEFMRLQFETFKHLYFEVWKTMPVPYWSDETFQSKNIFFVYPFFEGTKLMGMGIVLFPEGIKQERSARVEVLIESMRGVYLDDTHQNFKKGSYNSIKNKKEDTQPSKVWGFITSMFKRAS